MRALVVDDDQIFCRFLVEVLEENGLEVNWTTSALAAYELLSRESYDISIIDVRMPLLLGTEILEAIKQAHPKARMILASAFADEVLQEYARSKGILLLSKPFTTKQLLDAVQLVVRDSMGSN